MSDYEKACAVADKLRNIRMGVIVTAEDVLAKSEPGELDFYYGRLCGDECTPYIK